MGPAPPVMGDPVFQQQPRHPATLRKFLKKILPSALDGPGLRGEGDQRAAEGFAGQPNVPRCGHLSPQLRPGSVGMAGLGRSPQVSVTTLRTMSWGEFKEKGLDQNPSQALPVPSSPSLLHPSLILSHPHHTGLLHFRPGRRITRMMDLEPSPSLPGCAWDLPTQRPN